MNVEVEERVVLVRADSPTNVTELQSFLSHGWLVRNVTASRPGGGDIGMHGSFLVIVYRVKKQ